MFAELNPIGKEGVLLQNWCFFHLKLVLHKDQFQFGEQERLVTIRFSIVCFIYHSRCLGSLTLSNN